MSDYNFITWDTNGDIGASECLEVNVMGGKYVPSDDLDAAYRGIRSALDQAYYSPHTNIQGTIARKIDTDYFLNYTNQWSSGRQFLNNHGFGDGVYLWVACEVDSEASAWGGWGDNEQAFVDWTRFDGENLASVAVQEGLHPYILNGCDDVQDLTNGHDEHALGKVWNKWDGFTPVDEASPLCFTYVGHGAAGNGECGYYDDLEEGGNYKLTECTEKALEHSKDHHQNDHYWWRRDREG